MRLYGIILIAAVLSFSSACSSARPVSVGNKPVSVNDVPQDGQTGNAIKPLAEMSWTDFDGNVHKLKDLKGKVVILDFWATYCEPCIREIPHLIELQNKYGADRLVVVGLHVGGEEDQPKIPEFVQKLNITYGLAYPEDALTSYVFARQSAIPQTAVFDRDGRLVKKITGFSDAIKLELDDVVEKTVNGTNE